MRERIGFGTKLSVAALGLMLGTALACTGVALAQVPVALPIPIANTIAGLPSGGSSVACGTSIPTAFGNSIAGDGCVATAATLNDPYGSFVDSYGNVYFGDYNNYALRVIYMGGANLAAALVAANPVQTFTPTAGHVYTLAGGRTAALASTQGTTGGKQYYCNGAGSGLVGLNSKADNCPATYGYIKPRSPFVDTYGNVYFPSASGAALRVVYVSGTPLYNLLHVLNGVYPQPGFVYTVLNAGISGTYTGDGQLATSSTVGVLQERDTAVDSLGNVYMADGTSTFSPPTYSSSNAIREVNGTTGIISTYAGAGGCVEPTTSGCPGTYGGDGGLATSATLNSPYVIFFDKYNNLYIADYNEGRLRVVYQGGTVPGLSGLTAASVGNIYTVVGGGTATTSGVPATTLALGVVQTAGIDATGNLYVVDGTKGVMWRVDAATGIAVIIAGGKAGQTNGAYCNGGTSGPKSTDAYGDGCPATQGLINTGGKITVDRLGNLYEADSASNVLRKYSYNTFFPATATGATVTQPVAFTMVQAGTLTGETFTVQGGSASTFSDAGGDTCALNTALAAGTVCVVYVTFAPTAAGLVSGTLTLSTAAGPAVSYNLGGTGVGANTSVDPASTSTLGFKQTAAITGYNVTNEIVTFNATNSLSAGQLVTLSGFPTSTFFNGQTLTVLANGLSATQFEAAITLANTAQVTESGTGTYYGGVTPTGVAVDAFGATYLADSTGNRLVKVTAGNATVTTLMTGLSKPGQVALDNAGNVYVADAGNNRVAKVASGGGTVTSLGTGLSGPQGVVADNLGNVYVVDTGNNRVVELPAGGGQQTVLTISGLTAPTQIAVDASDTLYIADAGNARIVELALNHEQTTLNLGTTTISPQGVAVDAAGDVYVADTASDSIVEFAPGSVNGNQLVTGLIAPKGVAVDANGSLYVADSGEPGVLYANRALPTTDFPNTNINTGNTATINVTNTGNATLSFTGPQLTSATGNTAAFAVAAASSNGCSTSVPLGPGGACGLTATFTPTVKNTTYAETLSLVTNAANKAVSGALLTGTGVFLISTGTVIAVTSPTTSTINYAQSVTVSITVTPASSAGAAPTGTVKITVDGKQSTQTLPASGVVTVTLNPAVGIHAVSASYSGDVYYASSSNSYSFTVNKAVTVTTLGISVGIQGQSPTLTFTANVNSTTATGETQTVTFYQGTTPLATMTVSNGVASYTTLTTVFPAYSFSAVYSGDSNFAGSTSVMVSPKPDFTVVPSATSVTTPQGTVATLNSNITPLYNYSGTITASCSGLPANSVCRFSPVALALSGTAAQPFTVYIYTSVQSTLAGLEQPGARAVMLAQVMGWPFAAVMLLAIRRRKKLGKRMRLMSAVLLLVALGAGLATATGCNGTTVSGLNYVTPTGTSTVAVTYTDGTNSHTVNYSFTVNAPYPLP